MNFRDLELISAIQRIHQIPPMWWGGGGGGSGDHQEMGLVLQLSGCKVDPLDPLTLEHWLACLC